MKKAKLLNLGLIITSLLGYLEWGKSNHEFLFESEWFVLTKIFSEPMSVLHPFTVIPMLGQVVLLITLFQKKPNKILTYSSIAGLSLLLGFMFIIGIMSLNFKILLSTLPFLILSFITIQYHRKKT